MNNVSTIVSKSEINKAKRKILKYYRYRRESLLELKSEKEREVAEIQRKMYDLSLFLSDFLKKRTNEPFNKSNRFNDMPLSEKDKAIYATYLDDLSLLTCKKQYAKEEVNELDELLKREGTPFQVRHFLSKIR